jgi:hypothetical protein
MCGMENVRKSLKTSTATLAMCGPKQGLDWRGVACTEVLTTQRLWMGDPLAWHRGPGFEAIRGGCWEMTRRWIERRMSGEWKRGEEARGDECGGGGVRRRHVVRISTGDDDADTCPCHAQR